MITAETCWIKDLCLYDRGRVIGEDTEYVYLVIPKGEKGWEIGRGMDLKFISNQYFDGSIVSIYQSKNTKGFYVEVTDVDGKECKVNDKEIILNNQ